MIANGCQTSSPTFVAAETTEQDVQTLVRFLQIQVTASVDTLRRRRNELSYFLNNYDSSCKG